jgi:hypothetical protein
VSGYASTRADEAANRFALKQSYLRQSDQCSTLDIMGVMLNTLRTESSPSLQEQVVACDVTTTVQNKTKTPHKSPRAPESRHHTPKSQSRRASGGSRLVTPIVEDHQNFGDELNDEVLLVCDSSSAQVSTRSPRASSVAKLSQISTSSWINSAPIQVGSVSSTKALTSSLLPNSNLKMRASGALATSWKSTHDSPTFIAPGKRKPISLSSTLGGAVEQSRTENTKITPARPSKSLNQVRPHTLGQ